MIGVQSIARLGPCTTRLVGPTYNRDRRLIIHAKLVNRAQSSNQFISTIFALPSVYPSFDLAKETEKASNIAKCLSKGERVFLKHKGMTESA